MSRIFALTLVPTVALLAGCYDASLGKINSSPTAEITSHASGDTVREGFVETLRGGVGDPNHDISELTVTWVVDDAEVCEDAVPEADGTVICDTTFSAGGGQVVLEVRDPDGGTASASVDVDVQPTDAPVALIEAPVADGVYYAEQLTTFQGLVQDAEDDPSLLAVQWESGLDGVLTGEFDAPDSEGGLLGATELTAGEHFLTLTVTDTTGKEGRDSVTFVVGPPNTAPDCSITAPDDGSAGSDGAEVRFEGLASDVDVPSSLLTAVWSSDVDGDLRDSTVEGDGTVGFATSDLSVATHLILLTVTDEVGAECTSSVYYTVGTPPTLTVTTPTDGDVANEGENLAFAATVSDNEDLPTEITLSWSSDVDGEFSTQGADSTGEISFSTRDLSAGEHTLTVRATDTDGLYANRNLSLLINQLPTAPTVTLTPDPAYTADALVASASGSTDPDTSGVVTYAYAWYEDGTASSASTSATFPSASTAKDHTYRVVVTPNDGTGDGPTGEASVTVSNTAPVLTGPTLSASTVVVGDTLTCTGSATDADAADTPSVTYAWSDGSSGATYAVTDADDPGDTITCTATADDGDGGTDTGTASATVDNTAPVMGTGSVSPTTGQVGDVLTCSASATDADGGTPTLTYAWTAGTTGSTYTIASSDDPGDVVTCTATATDADGGTDTGTASATVVNTDPVMGTVSVSPTTGQVGDTLTCSATSTDADGGTPALAYAWSDGTSGSTYVVASSDDPGDLLTCTATATDTDGGTATGTASATVVNTDPVMGTVSVSPTTGAVGDTLTCSASATDVDGGTPTVTYAWTDGTTGSTYTIASSDDPGDVITCTATATDADSGTATGTATATVVNTNPVMGAVSVSPPSGQVGDTLSCSAFATDADGGTPTLSYAWPDGSTGSTYIIGSADDPGDSVTCTATATDADGGTDTGTASATVVNTDPVMGTVSVSPTTGQVGDTLTCSASSTDADGGTPTLSYAWTDGTTGSTFVIASGDDPGDTITCTATATDADGGTDTDTASATVANTDPVVGTVSVSPTTAQVGDTLTCSASSTDADGGTPTLSYAWTDGSTGSTYTVVAGDDPGDSITCTATATDADGGTGTGTASATVTNTDPVIASVSISPATGVTTSETLTCSASSTDADGGTPTLSYAWTTSGTGSASGSGATLTLAPGTTDVDDVVVCTATATDTDGGSGSDTASVTVENTAPTTPSISLAGLDSSDDLVCTVDTESTDADGDTVTYTYAWTVDGSVWTSTSTTGLSDTVDSADTAADDVWVCSVTASDGTDPSGADTASVTLLDSRWSGAIDVSAWSSAIRLYESSAVRLGIALALAPDIDGGGTDDLVVGDSFYSSPTGRVWVVFGETLASAGSSFDLASADVVITGAGGFFGGAVATGDIDGDGLTDVAVGASHVNSGGGAYVYLNATLNGAATLTASDADYFVYLSSNDDLGESVAFVDLDGDGSDELIVGANHWQAAYGSAFIFFDSSLTSSAVATTVSDYILQGSGSSGADAWSAGDLDGDGIDDLVFGEDSNDAYHSNNGAAFILTSTSFSSLSSGTSLFMSVADYVFYGDAGDSAGTTVAGVGDLDGDGYDDLVVGVPESAGNPGYTSVFLGSTIDGFSSGARTMSADDVRIAGSGSDRLGSSVRPAGDLDEDGYTDFLVGAVGSNAAYLFYGGVSAVSWTGTGDADVSFSGGTYLGAAKSMAGGRDINGDGATDLVLGAYGDAEAWVVLGQ